MDWTLILNMYVRIMLSFKSWEVPAKWKITVILSA